MLDPLDGNAPLEHTEVWLAFTGAEEVGSVGMHVLLDRCGEQLRDAYFLDFEMVGRGSWPMRHITAASRT